MTNSKIQLTAAQTDAIAIAAQLARTTWSIVGTDSQIGLDAVQVAFHHVLEYAFTREEGNDIAHEVFSGDIDSGSTKRKLTVIVRAVLAARAADADDAPNGHAEGFFG